MLRKPAPAGKLEPNIMTTATPVSPSIPSAAGVRTITWVGDTDGFVRLIDQTLLPTRLEYKDCRTVEEVWEAIRSLRVRGAPAIGVAAAMGTVVGLRAVLETDAATLRKRLFEVTAYL